MYSFDKPFYQYFLYIYKLLQNYVCKILMSSLLIQLCEDIKDLDENLPSMSQYSHIINQTNLIQIMLNEKLSNQLFHKQKCTIFKICGSQTKYQKNKKRIQYFANKYSFETLCRKFQKPKGENQLLKEILRVKIRSNCIKNNQTRKEIWMLVSGAKYYMRQNPELYKQLYEYKNYPQYFNKSINVDVTRTVKRQNSTQQMRRILINFSRRNPYIGYCQGFNYIVNFIINMNFIQQQAFWLFSQLLENIIPMDYYTNMIGVVVDQTIFIDVLQSHNKKLANKFKEMYIDISVFTIQWFVCLFTSTIPFHLVKILWDRLIIQGVSALLKCGIILLEEFEEEILNQDVFSQLIILIEQKSKKLDLTEDQFNSRFENIYISKEGLKLAQEVYGQHHIKKELAEKINKNNNLNLSHIKCNPEWPICHHRLEKSKIERNHSDIWIIREDNQPKLIYDYCQKLELEIPRSAIISLQTVSKNKLSNLMIGRIAHICESNKQFDVHKKETISSEFSFTRDKNNNTKYLQIQNLNLISQQESENQIISKTQINKPFMKKNKSAHELKATIAINNKLIPTLKKSKSIIFYKRFLENNKQLGQIISKID